ncbi:hypothetical protein HSBAA_43230 [Vreelandella sulfidaeris]|uniref:Uncharacterized protein n=1 Tax=Vreelandella sulfidaeris TaxID=115553 RepID=A0A455UBP7_9GAMM|nr:hypothetical protein HSBAA_43230 [Halomonas sulfidaeris]
MLDDSTSDVSIESFDVEADMLDLSDLLGDGDGDSLDGYFVTASEKGGDLKIEIGKDGQSSNNSATLKDVSISDFADSGEGRNTGND